MLARATATDSAAVASATAFTTFGLCQFFNALNSRSDQGTALSRRLFRNRWLWISFGVVVLLQIAIVALPTLGTIFNTVPLTGGQWLLCAATASTVLIVEEAVKLARTLTRPRATNDT